jgi:hypothetical protein
VPPQFAGAALVAAHAEQAQQRHMVDAGAFPIAAARLQKGGK